MIKLTFLQKLPKNISENKLGEGVAICFICEDALVFYKEVISRGIQAFEPFEEQSELILERRPNRNTIKEVS